MFARAVMVVVSKFVVCAVVLVLIIAWNVPSELTFIFYDEEVIAYLIYGTNA